MGWIPDQVDGGKPDNDDDKDGKMDKEAAQRRSVNLSCRGVNLVRFAIRRSSLTDLVALTGHLAVLLWAQRTTRAVTLLIYMPKDWSSMRPPP